MSDKPRKPPPQDEAEAENAERWLLSYADMMTLLVAFFIMMYSMSVVNIKKFDQIAIAIRSGFGGTTTSGKGRFIAEKISWSVVGKQEAGTQGKTGGNPYLGKGNEDWPEQFNREMSIFDYVKSQIAFLKIDETIQPMLDLESSDERRQNIIISDKILFEPGAVVLTPENIATVNHIATVLKDRPFKIQVEGYSSSVASNSVFEDSWKISTERARLVVNCLVSGSVNPRLLSVTGYGEWKDPTRTRRLAMSQDGEWRALGDASPKDSSKDRVVISIVISGTGNKTTKK